MLSKHHCRKSFILPLAVLVLLEVAPGDYRSRIDLAAYDEFVSANFAEVHRRLAQQVLTDYALDRGRVLEIAFGSPFLSIELARISALDFDVLVADSAELVLGLRRVRAQDLASRFRFHCGRVESLPFADNTFDLVLSRDAMRFWPSKLTAYREVNRVLKPGRTALLGGGLGRGYTGRDAARLWVRIQDWRNRTGNLPWVATSPYPEDLEAALDSTGFPDFRVWTEGGYCNCRTWVEWSSPQARVPAEAWPETSGEPPIGSEAPDFTLVDADGDTVRSADLKGRVVVIDFWGVDCRACINMMNALAPFWAGLAPGTCEVLAVNIDAFPEMFHDFLDENDARNGRMLYDDQGLAQAFGIRGLPHFVILDRQGIIRARIKGSTPAALEEIGSTVTRLLDSKN